MELPLLLKERAGQVRTCPANSEEHQSSSNDHEQNASGPTTEELVEELVKRGCTVTPAIVGPAIGSALKSHTRTRSADAERKAREREQNLKKGWKQLTIMAPNKALVREFLLAAAAKSKSPKILKALRAALEEPHLVTIGQKVLRLKGEAGDQVRRALDL